MSHKKGMHLSIGFKLIFITSLIVSSSLGGMIALATYYFKNDNVKRAQETTLDRASLVSLKVVADFNAIIDSTQLLLDSVEDKKNPEITFKDDDYITIASITGSPDSMKTEMLLENEKTLNKIGITELDFNQILESEKETIAGCFNTETVVFNASLYFNSPVIGIAAPKEIIQPGQAKNFMLIFVSMNRFLEAVKSQSIYTSFIVNGSGELLAHSDTGLVKAKANFLKMPIVTLMLKSNVAQGQNSFQTEEGKSYLGSYQKTGFSDVGVITIVDEEVAFAAVKQLQIRNIWITIIVINLAIFILFFFSKSLSNPIKRLAVAAEEIKQGNFEVAIKRTTRDEIGDLTESFSEMATGLAEREKMKDALTKFTNPEIAELALKGELKVGGERKHAAVFFSDIRSFTAISEKLEPEEVVEFLNEYMTRMVACVNQTKGVVDKFIGDAIMALWGAPISHGNDTENAINGALMMRKELMEFNMGRGGDKKPIIKIGCGINVGPLVAGQIGSDEKMEYTVIGDTVNLASRVEALNKPFGTDILITQQAYEETHGIFRVEPMQQIKVKGKVEAQQIYAVLSRTDDATGYKTLQEVRDALGIKVTGKPQASEEHEVKYEILDEKKEEPAAKSKSQVAATAAPRKSEKKDVKYEILD